MDNDQSEEFDVDVDVIEDENEIDDETNGDGEEDEESDSDIQSGDECDEVGEPKPHKPKTRARTIISRPSELNRMEKTSVVAHRIIELANFTGPRTVGEMTYLSADQLAKLGPITTPPFYYMQAIALA